LGGILGFQRRRSKINGVMGFGLLQDDRFFAANDHNDFVTGFSHLKPRALRAGSQYDSSRRESLPPSPYVLTMLPMAEIVQVRRQAYADRSLTSGDRTHDRNCLAGSGSGGGASLGAGSRDHGRRHPGGLGVRYRVIGTTTSPCSNTLSANVLVQQGRLGDAISHLDQAISITHDAGLTRMVVDLRSPQ
jgi:hypothetical protein